MKALAANGHLNIRDWGEQPDNLPGLRRKFSGFLIADLIKIQTEEPGALQHQADTGDGRGDKLPALLILNRYRLTDTRGGLLKHAEVLRDVNPRHPQGMRANRRLVVSPRAAVLLLVFYQGETYPQRSIREGRESLRNVNHSAPSSEETTERV